MGKLPIWVKTPMPANLLQTIGKREPIGEFPFQEYQNGNICPEWVVEWVLLLTTSIYFVNPAPDTLLFAWHAPQDCWDAHFGKAPGVGLEEVVADGGRGGMGGGGL